LAEVSDFMMEWIYDHQQEMPTAVSGIDTSTYTCADYGDVTLYVNGTQMSSYSNLQAGDSITANFNDCTTSYSGTGGSGSLTVSGSISFSVGSANGDPTQYSSEWDYSVTVSYDRWSITTTGSLLGDLDFYIDGSMTMAASYTPSASDLQYHVTGGPLVFNYGQKHTGFGNVNILYTLSNVTSGYTPGDAKDYSLDISSYDVASDRINGKVSAKTTTPLTGNTGSYSGYPQSGVLVLSGANSTSATMDASQCSTTEYRLTVNSRPPRCVSWSG